jgi:hypothetical protein
LNYHIKEKLLYHLGNLCIPESERVHVIREAHTSLIVGHFGVHKIVAQLKRFCYWPQMHETVSKYVKGCTMCARSKSSNRKIGLYTQISIPSRPGEIVSVDFVGGLPMSRKGRDYLYVVVDRFIKMCVLIPCKNQVTTEQKMQMFFENVWVHFGLPTSIVSNRDSRFMGKFFSILWELMDTRIKKEHNISSIKRRVEKGAKHNNSASTSVILQ